MSKGKVLSITKFADNDYRLEYDSREHVKPLKDMVILRVEQPNDGSILTPKWTLSDKTRFFVHAKGPGYPDNPSKFEVGDQVYVRLSYDLDQKDGTLTLRETIFESRGRGFLIADGHRIEGVYPSLEEQKKYEDEANAAVEVKKAYANGLSTVAPAL